jgi:hypothetical protein
VKTARLGRSRFLCVGMWLCPTVPGNDISVLIILTIPKASARWLCGYEGDINRVHTGKCVFRRIPRTQKYLLIGYRLEDVPGPTWRGRSELKNVLLTRICFQEDDTSGGFVSSEYFVATMSYEPCKKVYLQGQCILECGGWGVYT